MAKGNLDKFPFATKRGVRVDSSLFSGQIKVIPNLDDEP